METRSSTFGSSSSSIDSILPTTNHSRVPNRYSSIKYESSCNLSLVSLTLFALIGTVAVIQHARYNSLRSEFLELVQEFENATSGGGFMKEIREIESQMKTLKRQAEVAKDGVRNAEMKSKSKIKAKNKLLAQIDKAKGNMKTRVGKTVGFDGEFYSDEKLEKRDAEVEKRLNSLHEWVQADSRREVLERFGPGPHKVQIDVSIPVTSRNGMKILSVKNGSFVVEMAPIDLVPHAVHLFLEQVYHNLWDGCAFLIKSKTLIEAGPLRDYTRKHKDHLNRFSTLELDSLSIQEYSPDFPHVPFTLGYAGRPGGPDFYINMVNNTGRFGPGGHKFDLEEEADPAFAKIISGFETIKLMNQQVVKKRTGAFVKPIIIQNATVLDVEPGQYRHTYKEKGFYRLHDYQHYTKTKTKVGSRRVFFG